MTKFENYLLCAEQVAELPFKNLLKKFVSPELIFLLAKHPKIILMLLI